MKQIITTNTELLEVLQEHGIIPVCDNQMRMVITDSEAERVPNIVEQYAPAAAYDYVLE